MDIKVEPPSIRWCYFLAPPKSAFDKLPPPLRAQASRVVWTAVSMGHQSRLVGAWFETMGASSSERRIDSVFGNSFFWVITRSSECFY